MDFNTITVVLGDEFDDILRIKLCDVLRKIGANSDTVNRYLVGSQDIEEMKVYIDGQLLYVEAETYIGLSITGPESLVDKVKKLVEAY